MRLPLLNSNNVRKPTRWQHPLATIGLGMLGTLLAIAGILDHVETLITDAGDILIPFTFVTLVDWLYMQRRRTPAAAFFVQPRRLADRVVPSAIVSVAVGFVLGFWGSDFLPGFFYNTLPMERMMTLPESSLAARASTWRDADPDPQTRPS